MDWVIFLGLLAFIPAIIAARKGRSGLAWWIYGFFLFPVAFVHAIVTDDPQRNRVCPFCKMKIMNAATVCQHCQRDLPPPDTPPIENRIVNSGNRSPHEVSPILIWTALALSAFAMTAAGLTLSPILRG